MADGKSEVESVPGSDGWEVDSNLLGVDLHATEGSLLVEAGDSQVEVRFLPSGGEARSARVPKEVFMALAAELRRHESFDDEPTIGDICRAWGVEDVELSSIGPADAPVSFVVTSRAAATKRWRAAGEKPVFNAEVIGFSRQGSRRDALVRALDAGMAFRENAPKYV